MTRFTVIIPCYNAAATLAETLASLRAQTVTDWDAILVNDGSTDDTLAMIAAACNADPRLSALMLENGGPSRARNAAARLATGDYLAFLDADDLWLPGKLAEVAAAFDHPGAPAAVYGKIGFFRDSEAADFTTSTVCPGPATLAVCLGENPACTLSNLSVRRDVFSRLGGFDEALRYAEDMEFQLRLVGSGAVLFGVDSMHVRYRASDGGLSANLPAMHDGWCRAVSAARSAGAPISATSMRQAEAVHLRYLARRALRLRETPMVGTRLALRGMSKSPVAFLAGGYRGLATLTACLAAPLMPRRLRARLFA